MLHSQRTGTRVLGTFIDAGTWSQIVGNLLDWASTNRSGAVCLCNVHSAVTALDNEQLATALATAEMVLPDGAPVAWTMRRKGFRQQNRIAGPDLMSRICDAAASRGISIFLFGSRNETLCALETKLRDKFPRLDIRGTLSPRFGAWTSDEEEQYVATINSSGAEIVFVGLGCPKQEIWMAKNKGHVKGILLGVGAAFDFHAGVVQRAPKIYQKLGLEWAHRLAAEPRRLWKRYAYTNTRFLLNLPSTLLDHRKTTNID